MQLFQKRLLIPTLGDEIVDFGEIELLLLHRDVVRVEEQLVVIAGRLRLVHLLLLLLIIVRGVLVGARLVLPQRVQAITFLFAFDRSTAELFRSIIGGGHS